MTTACSNQLCLGTPAWNKPLSVFVPRQFNCNQHTNPWKTPPKTFLHSSNIFRAFIYRHFWPKVDKYDLDILILPYQSSTLGLIFLNSSWGGRQPEQGVRKKTPQILLSAILWLISNKAFLQFSNAASLCSINCINI